MDGRKEMELIGHYNPDDLNSNVNYFNNCMEHWLALYKQFGVEVNYYANLDELKYMYNQNKKNKSK